MCPLVHLLPHRVSDGINVKVKHQKEEFSVLCFKDGGENRINTRQTENELIWTCRDRIPPVPRVQRS